MSLAQWVPSHNSLPSGVACAKRLHKKNIALALLKLIFLKTKHAGPNHGEDTPQSRHNYQTNNSCYQ